MKIKYDKITDSLYIVLSNLTIEESDEEKKGVILDYSIDGELIGIEILNASKPQSKLQKVPGVLLLLHGKLGIV